jgi:hypothetical protein
MTMEVTVTRALSGGSTLVTSAADDLTKRRAQFMIGQHCRD